MRFAVPSLRERAEDIPLLVRHFAQQFSRRMTKTIDSVPANTMDALVHYHWPGNIRELQYVVERAVIVTQGSVLKVALGDLASAPKTPAPRTTTDGNSMQKVLQETERKQIVRALEQANWVISGPTGAAAKLGMNVRLCRRACKNSGFKLPGQAGIAHLKWPALFNHPVRTFAPTPGPTVGTWFVLHRHS